ncbi:MAG: DUF4157 domain-containing protein [Spirochaetia bacterium]|nr:DUF4157 domain-containing protein [Spirochaetia bacterium]
MVAGMIQRAPKPKKEEERIQRKLQIGEPGDRYEREADYMADRVVSMPEPAPVSGASAGIAAAGSTIQRQPLVSQISLLSGSYSQRKGGYVPAQVSPSVESRISQSRGHGQPLSPDISSFMGSRFGADFSAVRIHTGSEAASLSSGMNAHAFTVGRDIYFNSGAYNPHSTSGKRLLAHELTHTVQQGAVVRQSAMPVSQVSKRVQGWSIKGIIEGALDYIPGYSLLCVFLGKNPVTGSPVAQSGENLIKGVMGLIPGLGMYLFNDLKASGSTEKAGKWVDQQMKIVGISIPMIKGLIDSVWEKISIWNGIEGNLQVIKAVFGPVVGKVMFVLSGVMQKVKELIFEGFLRMAGSAGMQVMGILKKNPSALKRLIDQPVIIIKMFFQAVRQGFDNFKERFATHFMNAAMEWIFGTMSEGGLKLPAKFDMAGIFSIVFQVLNLTYQAIRTKVVAGLAKVVGPEKAEKGVALVEKGEKGVALVEKGVDIVKRIITEGPIALWEMVKDKLTDLKEMVIGGIVSWARNAIITKAILKLVSMLNPAGAIVQACIMIYDVVMFFISNWDRIKALVNAIFSSIAMAALGQIGQAASFVEQTMAKGLTLIISFLARLVGLGGIAEKVKEVITNIRKPVDAAIDHIVSFMINLAKPLIGVLDKGADKISVAIDKTKEKGKAAVTTVKDKAVSAKEKIYEWWKVKKGFKNKAGESHTIYFEGKDEKARLMIHSLENDMINYINGNVKEERKPDALKLVSEIASEKRKMKKKGKSKIRILSESIETKMALLAEILKREDQTLPIRSVVNFTPFISSFGGGDLNGGKMTAAPLSLARADFNGSPPSEYSKLYTTVAKARPNKYVRGHLLNENLHGPGVLKNLAPMPRNFNNPQMLDLIETEAKKAVLVRREVVSYEIKFDYSGHKNRKYVPAETFLPTKMHYSLAIMKPNASALSDTKKAKLPSNWEIDTTKAIIKSDADISLPDDTSISVI